MNEICAGENIASRDTNEELEEPQEILCYKAETWHSYTLPKEDPKNV